MNNPELQKQALVKWATRLIKEVEQRGVIAKSFISAHLLKIEMTGVIFMNYWIWILSNIFKRKDKDESTLDIRNYFMKK